MLPIQILFYFFYFFPCNLANFHLSAKRIKSQLVRRSALDMKHTSAGMKAALGAVKTPLLHESIKNTCPNESWWW